MPDQLAQLAEPCGRRRIDSTVFSDVAGYCLRMARPIEMLTPEEAGTATEIILSQVVIFGEDVSWDWSLCSPAHDRALAVSAYRSRLSEPPEILEAAVRLTLVKVGLELKGDPVERSTMNSLRSVRYRVGPADQY